MTCRGNVQQALAADVPRAILTVGGDSILECSGVFPPDRLDMPVDLVAAVEMRNGLAHEGPHPQPDGFDQRQQHKGGPDLIDTAMKGEVALDAEFDVAAPESLVDEVVEMHQTLDPECSPRVTWYA